MTSSSYCTLDRLQEVILTARGDQQNVFDQPMSARVVSLVLVAEVRRPSVARIPFTDASWR